MKLHSIEVTGHIKEKGKMTCVTCNLRGCVGQCKFKAVEKARGSKAA